VHVPSGLSVKCQDTRYLEQNRKIARERLREKLEHAVDPENSKLTKMIKKNQRRKSKRARRSRLKYAQDSPAAENNCTESSSDTE
jgi:protein subunit release factor A